jgi:hypothetical protein
MPKAYHSRVLIPLFENQSGAGVSETIELAGEPDNVGVYIVWTGTPTAGAVSIETAHRADYAGVWAQLATSTFQSNAVKYFSFEQSLNALRVRITTAVTGGSVSAYVIGR